MYAALCLLLLFSLQKISISGIILLLLVHFSPSQGWWCLNDGLLSCLPIQFPSSLHGKKKIWVLWRIRYQIPTPHTAKQNGEQWRPCWTFLLKWEHAVLDGYLLWPHISPRTFLLLLFWLSVTKRRTPLKMMFGSFRRNIKFAVDIQKESQRSTSGWWFPGFCILYLAIFGMTFCLSHPICGPVLVASAYALIVSCFGSISAECDLNCPSSLRRIANNNNN